MRQKLQFSCFQHFLGVCVFIGFYAIFVLATYLFTDFSELFFKYIVFSCIKVPKELLTPTAKSQSLLKTVPARESCHNRVKTWQPIFFNFHGLSLLHAYSLIFLVRPAYLQFFTQPTITSLNLASSNLVNSKTSLRQTILFLLEKPLHFKLK